MDQKSTDINEQASTLIEKLVSVLSSVCDREYITVLEASEITGLKKETIRDSMKRAGVCRIGKSAYLRNEFFSYWKYRTKVEDAPQSPHETARMRQARIEAGWRSAMA
jgi:hypothetical protein